MDVCKECLHDIDKCICLAQGPKPPSSAEKLAQDHWSYVEKLLEAHGEHLPNIDKVKFHYISAFIHGYKHAKEGANG